MMTIEQYLDLARARSGAPSDNALSRRLEMSQQAVHHWRRGHSLPKDEQIVRLAALAGIDPGLALLDLNIWRAKDQATREQYSALRAAVTRAGQVAAFVLVLLGFLLFGLPGTPIEQLNARDLHTIYYGK